MLGRFNAPALLVFGMDAVVPADRIFEPLFAGVAQCRFDLRADVCLADAAIEISHEDDGRNLLQQRAILGLEIRSVWLPCRCGSCRSQATELFDAAKTLANSSSSASASPSSGSIGTVGSIRPRAARWRSSHSVCASSAIGYSIASRSNPHYLGCQSVVAGDSLLATPARNLIERCLGELAQCMDRPTVSLDGGRRKQ